MVPGQTPGIRQELESLFDPHSPKAPDFGRCSTLLELAAAVKHARIVDYQQLILAKLDRFRVPLVAMILLVERSNCFFRPVPGPLPLAPSI